MSQKGRKMQHMQFAHVDEFLAFLPDDELAIVETLRDLVFETLPDVREKLSYNVPYYSRYRTICFIWPGSVAWGSKTRPGVELGFARGHLMADAEPFLEKGKRKFVYYKRFFHTSEVDRFLVKKWLLEAAEIDQLIRR